VNKITDYKFLNNVVGWLVFIFASAVYLMTIEPTASWWDCGEYIATSYKLQVGHPPGAPFFQLMGRFFSLFAFGDVTLVAKMVNTMSALMSGLTILFTFWTITAIAKKFYSKEAEMTMGQKLAVIGAGLVGALAYTFSDSFWFSAVEGEVYATSSMFTAAVVWAMMKWEAASDSPYHLKWIILIAFLMGLSVGVHLLNLLTIPALTYIYYFKKFKTTTKGFILTGILSLIILGIIQAGIIPYVVKLAGGFELFFVNSVGMPFNSGTIIYFVLLLALIVFGLYISRKKAKVVLNTAILAFAFILIGYSSFFMLVIRANSNTPINENAPKDAISLLGYLNRDQYGDWPILYGQYYNAEIISSEETGDIYQKGQENGKDKYVVISKKIKYKYDPKNCGFFPRMWSDQPKHVNAYKEWTGNKSNHRPTFGENISFFVNNQLGNQYWRYFMWNFVGRQNDFQGFGLDGKGNKDIQNGNWLSGIDFIDEARLGTQQNLPDRLANNKARNTFYFLPLLLGLLGMVYHFMKRSKDAFVVAILFVLTGIAIIVYLNPTPYQPRERDYAYAGSFYAFAMWIGLGVIALFDIIRKKIPQIPGALIATIASVLLVPVIMGAKGWNDHDRSNKYACRDFAKNYLNSCAPNAILITNGDNDTFPLWYAQEVEGIRTDVRVVNFTLASGDWYIHQLYNKLYKSDPLPFTLKSEQYTQGTNDFVPFMDQGITGVWDLKKVIEFIASDNPKAKATIQKGKTVAFLPTKDLMLTVDSLKVLRNGTVPAYMADRIEKAIVWKMKKNTLYKNDLMLLDFLATNNWDRPVYFASPNSVSDFLDIEDYCHLEGAVYRLLPVKNDAKRGGVLADRSYDLMTKDFVFGNIADPKVYCDKESYGMSQFARNNFARVAQALIMEGKKDKAIKCLDKGTEVFPDLQVPYDMYMIGYGELYFQAGEFTKGTAILQRVADVYQQNLVYFLSLDKKRQRALDQDISEAAQVLQAIGDIAKRYKQDALYKSVEDRLNSVIGTQQ
jgi:tetratricopeptide (TPR) repeat protein